MSSSILVVDDEPQVSHFLERVLKDASYVVSAAENGRQALAYIQAENFDLILLDILMPDMDGLEFLRELLRAKLKPKVVAISGQLFWLRAAKQLGARAILPKPISAEVLLQVVSETLMDEAPNGSTD